MILARLSLPQLEWPSGGAAATVTCGRRPRIQMLLKFVRYPRLATFTLGCDSNHGAIQRQRYSLP